MTLDLDRINLELGNQPDALLDWALGLGKQPLITSNFRPFSAPILHMVTQKAPNIPVLWMDNGYATAETYRFADALTEQLRLNLHIYHPRRSRAHREAVEGPYPALDDPRHAAFTEEVKLEPFERALAAMNPEVWITGLRGEDTAERSAMQPVSLNKRGMIKVAPILAWNSRDLHEYCKRHGLPNYFEYFDPTKAEDHRECGLHTMM
jgi:phosphoadenosine phosphosulfate reductase